MEMWNFYSRQISLAWNLSK